MSIKYTFMETTLKHFAGYILMEKGLSKNTMSAYASDLRFFIEYLRENKIDKFQDVTRNDILFFLEDCSDNGLESASLARRLVSIKVFYRYLLQEKIIKADITPLKAGKWYLQLESEEGNWRVAGQINSPKDKTVRLEPQISEDSSK